MSMGIIDLVGRGLGCEMCGIVSAFYFFPNLNSSRIIYIWLKGLIYLE